MSTKKLVITTVLALAFLSQASQAAFAEDEGSNDDSSSFVAPSARPTAPAPLERKHHGDRPSGEAEGHYQVAVPPVVIKPYDTDDSISNVTTGTAGIKQNFKVAPPKGSAEANTSVPDTAGKERVIEPKSASFDPNANEPIEMQNVQSSKKTPADVFIESAQIGVGAMAAGAAVLGAAAAVRGVRFRRQVETDFIYEVEN